MVEHECSQAGSEELIEAYVTGRLAEARAAALEEHFLECEQCWEEVERGMALRAAFVRGPVARRARAPRAWLGAGLLAAGLVVAVVAYRPWAPSTEPVYRGARALTVTARIAAGQATLEWQRDAAAASYVVEVSAGDGSPRFRAEIAESRVSFPSQRLEPRAQGAWLVKVKALDALGNVIAESDPVLLQESDGH